jgi:hypothetical protein
MVKTTAKPRPGRYADKKKKAASQQTHTQRCKGCGCLLSQNRSVPDHEMFCEKAIERNELSPARGIDYVKGDLRGGYRERKASKN